ncbi:MAG: hypothetical protein QOD06_493 [Candidatus Binatota bacterium]|nr:hypothetical protein [Candidatus Binatota bacterium]
MKPAGYYGLPVVKPPVWTWEIPVYFFVGGLAGMAEAIALAAFSTGAELELVRKAAWVAAAGAGVSPILLVMDLGRPARFANMLRVFKWRSAMSVGAWTLAVFGACAVPAALLLQWGEGRALHAVAALLLFGAGVLGPLLATYTGVLLAATAIPVWSAHRTLLPIHFGAAALGSAAAVLELLGSRPPALSAVGIATAIVETMIGAALEIGRASVVDRPLRTGRSGNLMRAAAVLTGPLSLALRLVGARTGGGAAFLFGALLSRFAWIDAGRCSALDPEATFASQAPP